MVVVVVVVVVGNNTKRSCKTAFKETFFDTLMPYESNKAPRLARSCSVGVLLIRATMSFNRELTDVLGFNLILYMSNEAKSCCWAGLKVVFSADAPSLELES